MAERVDSHSPVRTNLAKKRQIAGCPIVGVYPGNGFSAAYLVPDGSPAVERRGCRHFGRRCSHFLLDDNGLFRADNPQPLPKAPQSTFHAIPKRPARFRIRQLPDGSLDPAGDVR